MKTLSIEQKTEADDEAFIEVSYSSSAEGFVFNGWRYFWLGIDSYELLYY